MDKIIERLSAYNLFTNLFPGTIYCYLADVFFNVSLIQDDLLHALFIYYFVGMAISRIGSLVVEPILEATKFVQYADYSDYIEASSRDELIPVLLETNNSYRSVLSLLFCIVLTGLWVYLASIYPSISTYGLYVVVLILIVLFLFSYRKQTRYIFDRVKRNVEKGDTKG